MWTRAVYNRAQKNIHRTSLTHCQRNEESQSMFEIQFTLGTVDFIKYSLQFF